MVLPPLAPADVRPLEGLLAGTPVECVEAGREPAAVLSWNARTENGCRDGCHGLPGVSGIGDGDGAGVDGEADGGADADASTGRFESLIRMERSEVAHDRCWRCRGTVVRLQRQEGLLFYGWRKKTAPKWGRLFASLCWVIPSTAV